jgi:hypothetical protein
MRVIISPSSVFLTELDLAPTTCLGSQRAYFDDADADDDDDASGSIK